MKQIHKGKEQLVREQELARKRQIIVEKFYPALIEATISVDEAKMLLHAAASLIMEEVLNEMKTKDFAKMYNRVIEKLTPNDERLIQIENLFGPLKTENLYVAREIIEGMSRAIEQMVTEDMQNRKLDTLKPDWDKYLNR